MTWESVAEAKRKLLIANIPEEWILKSIPTAQEVPNAVDFIDKQLTPEELEITYSTIKTLQAQIESGNLTATKVVRAFSHRSALLHQLTNCCSEIFFDKALERAEKLDKIFKDTGKTVGPLHGIPLSAKDQLNIEGLDSAMGFVSLLNKPKTKDEEAKLVEIMEDYGAVFFVKTTTPMAMMAITTTSNIYGETVNAFNRNVSCGGSSGGEGALIGGHGAPCGFGTDIGGSIRVPSGLNGIYGLRGTTNRLPYLGLTNSFASQPVLSSVVGPMACDLDDLKYIMKLIVEAKPWFKDPKVPPIEWKTISKKDSKLSFAIASQTKTAKPTPAVQRAMDLLIQKLKAAGHEIVEWNPPVSTEELNNIAIEVYGADGYKEVDELCKASGEPIVPEILPIAGKSGLPKGVSHIHEHWDLARKRYEAQQKVDEYWRLSTAKLTKTGKPVDAILCPVLNVPSFKTPDVLKVSLDLTSQFNTLDYPTLVVPVTKVDKTVDTKPQKFHSKSLLDQNYYDLYDEQLMDGVPIGVQIVDPKRYHEEEVIAIGEVVRDVLAST